MGFEKVKIGSYIGGKMVGVKEEIHGKDISHKIRV